MAVDTLGELIRTSSHRHPDRPAVVCGNVRLTYAELDERSDRLAAWLRSIGAGRGERVGLSLPKSLEAVTAIVGTLKAGAAYVPLDPIAPPLRMRSLIGHAAPRCLIAGAEQLEGLRTLEPMALPYVLSTDNTASVPWPWPLTTTASWLEVLSARASGPPVDGPSGTDLAYILYTSGSTGQPKGVMVTHRQSLAFVQWAQAVFQLQPEDRVSSHAPLHFDLSLFDLFVTWTAGACVYLIPQELNVFPTSLAEFIEQTPLSVWYSVPSALTRLLLYGQLDQRRLETLRLVLFAGEVFPTKYLRRLKGLLPAATLYNLYGPTETNVCTYYHVGQLPPEDSMTIPIGKGCEHNEVFAVDEQGQRIRPGEVGELCVRGPTVMRGYWKAPEETARVLVRHWPWLGDAPVCRTGDLVRCDAGGTYHFLGRQDTMVKSRGYRIELGEIESTLASHPAIKEAAVVAVQDEEIGNRLKAFVASDEPLGGQEVLGFLAERLPRYMMPDSVDVVEQLPKTSTGKLDRQRLRMLERNSP